MSNVPEQKISVLDWAKEHLDNAERMAAVLNAPGGEAARAARAEWLKDAAYWRQIVADQDAAALTTPPEIFKGHTAIEILAWDRGWKEASRQARELAAAEVERLNARIAELETTVNLLENDAQEAGERE